MFCRILALAAFCAAAAVAPVAGEPTLTRAAQVLNMPGEVAGQHLPVTLSGVVTASEPDWEGRFFVQDASGGVFVIGTDPQPRVGEHVEITGVTAHGAFAPIVISAHWQVRDEGGAERAFDKLSVPSLSRGSPRPTDRAAEGRAGTLPPAHPTSVERLLAGIEDGQRVEIVGTVRSVYTVREKKVAVDVAMGGTRVHTFPKLPPQLNPETLVGAKVRVRGTVAASFNATLHQLTSINIYVPVGGDFIVEEPEAVPPFTQPLLPLSEIARYRPDVNRGGRIHVRGVVTLYRPGLDLYIQDGTGGLHIETTQTLRLQPGDAIEAVGFLDIAGFRPVLEDSRMRPLEHPPQPIAAARPTFPELRQGRGGSQLVTLQGKLVGRTVRPVRRDSAGFVGFRTLCTVQNDDMTFTAECEQAGEATPLESLTLGSVVAVTGVAALETGDDGQLKTLTLLQRTPADLRVIQAPSWFTPQRMLVLIGAMFVVALTGIVWSVTVSKKNAMLNFLVTERERTQRELQQAHDLLEQRVKERTEQLQLAMTARKTAELEFKATLTERTRLARDLHDTLEQALTGIALQLDTTARLLQRSPAEAERHLELARGFMRQSQLELRRSIWDLRSRELEQFDIARALRHTSEQLAKGTQLKVEVETEGPARALPEIIEENLLRIGQEAVTNVVKHSGATLATLRLGFAADSVTLEVRDNGTGLQSEKVAGDHHFGLVGMAERSKRLGGRFSIVGAPGEGTTVTVSVPVQTMAEAAI